MFSFAQAIFIPFFLCLQFDDLLQVLEKQYFCAILSTAISISHSLKNQYEMENAGILHWKRKHKDPNTCTANSPVRSICTVVCFGFSASLLDMMKLTPPSGSPYLQESRKTNNCAIASYKRFYLILNRILRNQYSSAFQRQIQTVFNKYMHNLKQIILINTKNANED